MTHSNSFRGSVFAYLLTLVMLIAWGSLQGQDPSMGLMEFNTAHIHQERSAMLVLGGWAMANIGTGLAFRGEAEGSTRSFHEMNALWNTVNLAIAGFSYYSAIHANPESWDLATSLREQQRFQRILLFNAGLDVGYVVAGLYLTERARRPGANTDRLKGFGRSIMVQGGFLFIFDLANYFISSQRGGSLPLRLGAAADGLGLSVLF